MCDMFTHLIIFTLIQSGVQDQKVQFERLAAKVLQQGEFQERVIETARLFLGAPYQARTLE